MDSSFKNVFFCNFIYSDMCTLDTETVSSSYFFLLLVLLLVFLG